ncbi:hypothetical protein [Streptomyces sp. NPDC048737]|uniref:hypothetical protein n=1 Tax=unclassified Streptomyces TaxID=2593676 RepID=UPI0034289EED
MTVPEENRKKTDTTDEPIDAGAGSGGSSRPGTASGRTMREAMEEAGVRSEDHRASGGPKAA